MISGPDHIIFDWGNTIMRDLQYPGPMWDWPEVACVAGAESALRSLSGPFTLVIATSADHSNAEEMIRALKRVQADRYFSYFFSSKELGWKKPEPQFFSQILLKLRIDPARAISVGDKYPNDVSAAKACGLYTVWLNETRLTGSFPDADVIITGMAELPDAIGRLSQTSHSRHGR